MFIYYAEVSLDDGFEVLKNDRRQMLWKGRRVSPPAGKLLYEALRAAGEGLKCWKCGLEANCFIVNKNRNDQANPHPVMDLYARTATAYTLMTRDHIIPKSFGGSNDVDNLRVGCAPCNHGRGNNMGADDILFLKENQHLVSSVSKALSDAIKLEQKRARRRAAKKRRKARLAQTAPQESASLQV